MTFKDWIIRSWLDIKMNYRYIFSITEYGNELVIPDEYNQIFNDDFKSDYHLKWDNGAEFGIQPYHPAQLWQWYDPEQIKQTSNGVELSSVVKPKYFEEINTSIPNAIGMLRTKDAWKYGIFIFQAKLPSGMWLWPALWLSGRWNWPPEIDVVEALSENTYNYDNNRHITSNIHRSDGKGGDKMTGSRKHRLPNQTTKEYIEYALWWEEDFIKIYYNGYLVLHVTDKDVLNGMFEAQRIIIGNGTETNFKSNNLTPLIVKTVEIFQK